MLLPLLLLPPIWLRKRRLKRALEGYALYDPPHKREERVLAKEQALENFEYFTRVRQERVEFFKTWLRRRFGVVIEANEKGVEALSRWATQYAGFLLPTRTVEKSYFSYDPPWTEEGAGCNVVFDIGVTLGELIIANCPKLRWDMDPTSAVDPKGARVLKREFGSSFQRPELTGFDNPNWGKTPLHDVYGYACQLKELTTLAGIWHFYDSAMTNGDRHCITHAPLIIFEVTLREFRAGDPTTLYGSTGIPIDLGDDDE